MPLGAGSGLQGEVPARGARGRRVRRARAHLVLGVLSEVSGAGLEQRGRVRARALRERLRVHDAQKVPREVLSALQREAAPRGTRRVRLVRGEGRGVSD